MNRQYTKVVDIPYPLFESEFSEDVKCKNYTHCMLAVAAPNGLDGEFSPLTLRVFHLLLARVCGLVLVLSTIAPGF